MVKYFHQTLASVTYSNQNEVKVATNKAARSHIVKKSLPSLSTVFLSDRRKKVAEAKRLFDLSVLEDAEYMHLHLMKSIEDMNKLSSLLNILAHYSIRAKDEELVRSGLECGQLFICRRNISNDSVHYGNEKTKSAGTKVRKSQGHIEADCKSIRRLSLSAFFKEYEDLKYKASRVRDVQKSSSLNDRDFSIPARRDVTHINFDSSVYRKVVDRRQNKKEFFTKRRSYILNKNCTGAMDDDLEVTLEDDLLSKAYLNFFPSIP